MTNRSYGSPRSRGRRSDDTPVIHSLTGGSDGSQLQQGRNGVSRRGADLLQGQRAAGDAAETAGGPASRQAGDDRLVAHPQQEGLGRVALAEGIWRHRLELGAALHLQRGTADGAGAVAARLRRQHGRPGDLHLRQRGAEEALSAAHRQCRRLVVPGLFGAGLRLRPRLAEDQGRAQGRQIHRQRPEDLDHAGAVCRHDLLPVPHRSQRRRSSPASPSS